MKGCTVTKGTGSGNFDPSTARLNRRGLLTAAAGCSALAFGLGRIPLSGSAASAYQGITQTLVIDLATEPAKLDPATIYDVDGWSVIHSIYDSLVQYGPGGELEPLLAESFTLVDPLTYRVKLREGITFHTGEPLDGSAIAPSIAHILDEETGSQVAGNFSVIIDTITVDEMTVDLKLSAPAPWLPAQIAAWLVMLPPSYISENDFIAAPVGTGPYRFDSASPGDRIALAANDEYFAASPKGQPIAARVDYRFVPDATTRVADLLSDTAQMVRGVPVDQIRAVEQEGDQVAQIPVSGCAFVRVPTDVSPYSDVRVRQAVNYAIDVQSIVDALLAGDGRRLPNLFVPNGLGYDPGLEPYPYDPEKARFLLAEAGYPDGFDTAIDMTVTERPDLVDAIVAQLGEAGIRTTVNVLELALFNSSDYWLGTDPAAAPLRFVTWRPLFDPHTLLSLVISNTGFLSRHDNPTIQTLLDDFSMEPDPETRAGKGRALGVAMRDEPAAIYLYNLTSNIGVSDRASDWTPREDDYLIATHRA